eukprot:6847013-Prymnesium_polylepis.2
MESKQVLSAAALQQRIAAEAEARAHSVPPVPHPSTLNTMLDKGDSGGSPGDGEAGGGGGSAGRGGGLGGSEGGGGLQGGGGS